jgi:hypothetical protein
MIPRVLRPERVPYASVAIVPAPGAAPVYWVRLQLHATGAIVLHHADSVLARACYIVATAAYADVLAQGSY